MSDDLIRRGDVIVALRDVGLSPEDTAMDAVREIPAVERSVTRGLLLFLRLVLAFVIGWFCATSFLVRPWEPR